MIGIAVMIVMAFIRWTVVMAMVVVTRHIVTVRIMAVKFVAGDMCAPIRMDFFPVMKARHAD